MFTVAAVERVDAVNIKLNSIITKTDLELEENRMKIVHWNYQQWLLSLDQS